MLDIKSMIKQKGYSVTSLAEKLGMTQISLSRIINGNPTIETLQKIANALDVEVVELFAPINNKDEETLFIHRDGKYEPVGFIKKGI